MSKKAKIEIIHGIESEKHLREKVLRILLMKMGYKGVTVTHGSEEHGKDLVFYEVDSRTGSEINYAIVAKLGKLKAGSTKDNNNIANIYTQVMRAFKIPYEDPQRGRQVSIHRVWVVTNGTISAQACKEIINMFGEHKDYYERNVEFFKASRLYELLSDYYEDFFLEADPFLIHYARELRSGCQHLNELKSLGYSKKMKELMEVYTEPTFVEHKRRVKGEKKPKSRSKKYQPLMTKRTLNEISLAKNHVWLVGQPGCGKSTTIRNMVLSLTRQIEEDFAFENIPVMLRFKDIVDKKGHLPIERIIENTLRSKNTFNFDIKPKEWIRLGKVTLFLDGLDEIPTKELREKSVENLLAFMKSYPGVKVTAACRDIGFDTLRPKLKAFCIIDIFPFNFRQMKKFVNKWFAADELSKEKMLTAVKSALLSGRLPKTPMVLTLLAILFDQAIHQELPANLTELYSLFTELLLGRWDVQRDVHTMFDYHIKENVLMNLAYEMHSKGADGINKEGLHQFIQHYSDDRKMGVAPNNLVQEIVERSQLLVSIDDIYSFKHLSFQEFFVSKYWTWQSTVEKTIPEKALDPWWEKVVFFYIGEKKDAPDLLDKIISKGEPKTDQDELAKYLNIGQLLQAAYLTAHNKKVEAIDFVLTRYSDLMERMWKAIESAGRLKMSELLFTMVMKDLFAKNYASTTLKEAMAEIFQRIWTPKSSMDDKVIFNSYLLAYALAMLESSNFIEDMATEPNIIDPVLLPIMDIDLSWLESEYGWKFDKKILVKLKKRIRAASEAIRKALK